MTRIISIVLILFTISACGIKRKLEMPKSEADKSRLEETSK